MNHTIPIRIAAGRQQQMARKPASLVGMEPATDIESYDAVPWCRKNGYSAIARAAGTSPAAT